MTTRIVPALVLSCVLALTACPGATPSAGPPPSPTSAMPSSPSPSSPSSSPEVKRFRPRPVEIDHGPRTVRVIALTFDADMTDGMLAQLRSGEVRSWYNEAVIRELRKTGTPATLFLAGQWAQAYPKATKELARDPLFELANHSWDHAAWTPDCYDLPSVEGERAKRREVEDAADEIERLTGERPIWFRFPGGCHATADPRLVARLGEQAVGWDVVSGDAFGTDPNAVAQAVIDQAKPGSIVVMHLHGGPNALTTAPALKRIIPALRDRGYRFVTLSELFGVSPGA